MLVSVRPSCFYSLLRISKNFFLSFSVAIVVFSAWHLFQTYFQSMIMVFDIRTPLKIRYSIVRFVSVFVIYLRFVFWIFNVKLCQASMKIKLFYFSLKTDIKNHVSRFVLNYFYLLFIPKNFAGFFNDILRIIFDRLHFVVLKAEGNLVNG